jgi:hypothetical protein
MSCKYKKLRACRVNGKKAFFHKWVEKETPIIQFDSFYTDKEIHIADMRKLYLPPGTRVTSQRQTLAIIEYMDGTVAEVLPEEIQFINE